VNKYRCALLHLGLSLGCVATQNEALAPTQGQPGTPGAEAPSARGTSVREIQRRDVQEQLARGLGDFLSRIEVEPSLEGGKFQGFRVVALTDPELWAGVDLQTGDIVRRVNGADLEEPDTVFNTFVALKQAREVTVELVREGQPRLLRLPIVGEPLKEPQKDTAAPAQSSAATSDKAASETQKQSSK
jgi:hypothetical protein